MNRSTTQYRALALIITTILLALLVFSPQPSMEIGVNQATTGLLA